MSVYWFNKGMDDVAEGFPPRFPDNESYMEAYYIYEQYLYDFNNGPEDTRTIEMDG